MRRTCLGVDWAIQLVDRLARHLLLLLLLLLYQPHQIITQSTHNPFKFDGVSM